MGHAHTSFAACEAAYVLGCGPIIKEVQAKVGLFPS